MAPDRRHDAWLKFTRAILDIPLGRSREELITYLHMAEDQHPSLVPIIKCYIELAERSTSNYTSHMEKTRKTATSRQKHLFDLLRAKEFFPQTLDLARFAARIIPEIPTSRFSKISREEIAAKIIVYIEGKGPSARRELEMSMRNALSELGDQPRPAVERQSFLSKWERIIKGTTD